MAESDNSHNLEQEIAALKADLNKIRADLSSMSSTAAHLGRDSAKYAGEAAAEKLQEGMECVEDCVRQRPITTVLIAFSTGLIAAKLLGRRR